MGKPYAGENSLTFLINLTKTGLKEKVAKTDIVNDLTSTDPTKVLSAAQGKALSDAISQAGGGDMLKAAYDADNDGVVDDAKKLDGHAADYFATSTAPAEYIASIKGQASGICPLEADKKINSIYLPSYVDDIVEGYLNEGFFYEDEAHSKLITGEAGKIYVDIPTNLSYRYSGSTYILITSSDMVEISNVKVQEIWDSIE